MMYNIGSILDHALKELKYGPRMKEYRVLEVWGKVVGEHIADHTQAENIRNGKLFVRVSSHAWMCELESLKQTIIERINGKMGKGIVKELHFTLGEIPFPNATDTTSTHGQLLHVAGNEDCQESIEKDLSHIRDPNIREVLLRLMIKDAKLRESRTGWR